MSVPYVAFQFLGVAQLPRTVAAVEAAALPARDLKLDFSNDALVIKNSDLVFVRGIDSIAQDIHMHLTMFLGEWFLDENLGVPYFERIMRKFVDKSVAQKILTQEILSVAGVAAVTSVTFEQVLDTETLYIRWVVQSDLGEIKSESVVA